MSDTTAQPGLDSLSKSFEPAALEAHWGPEWEKRGYGNAGYRGTGAPQAGEPAFSVADATLNLFGVNERNFNRQPVTLWVRERQGAETRELAEMPWIYLGR